MICITQSTAKSCPAWLTYTRPPIMMVNTPTIRETWIAGTFICPWNRKIECMNFGNRQFMKLVRLVSTNPLRWIIYATNKFLFMFQICMIFGKPSNVNDKPIYFTPREDSWFWLVKGHRLTVMFSSLLTGCCP